MAGGLLQLSLCPQNLGGLDPNPFDSGRNSIDISRNISLLINEKP